MADIFGDRSGGLDSPARSAQAVDISSTDHTFAQTTRSLYVGTAGDVKVDMADTGTGVTFTGMAAGWHPIRVTKVYKTGTTAAAMVGVW